MYFQPRKDCIDQPIADLIDAVYAKLEREHGGTLRAIVLGPLEKTLADFGGFVRATIPYGSLDLQSSEVGFWGSLAQLGLERHDICGLLAAARSCGEDYLVAQVSTVEITLKAVKVLGAMKCAWLNGSSREGRRINADMRSKMSALRHTSRSLYDALRRVRLHDLFKPGGGRFGDWLQPGFPSTLLTSSAQVQQGIRAAWTAEIGRAHV